MTASSAGPRPALRPFLALAWAGVASLAVARLFSLTADPPARALFDFITDEGWYSLNARNQALFGRWAMDEHNVALVLCPLHTLALRLSYALFGTSLASTRLPGALASVLTVAIVAWRLRRWGRAGVLGTALVAAGPLLFGMARVAFVESLQLLGMVAWWAAASTAAKRLGPAAEPSGGGLAPRSATSLWIVSGAAAAAAFFAKESIPWLPLLALAAPWFVGHRRRGAFRDAIAVAVGLALVTLPCMQFVLRFLPLFLAESGREGRVLWMIHGHPAGAVLPLLLGLLPPAGELRRAFWVEVLPLTLAFGVAGARLLLASAARASPAVRLAVAWLACGFAFLALRRIAALEERYWMNAAVPVAVLVAAACRPLVAEPRPERWRRVAAALLLAYAPALALRPLVFPLVRTYAADLLTNHFHRALAIPVLLVLLALALAASSLCLPERCVSPRFPAVRLVALLVALSAAVSLAPVVRPHFTVRDAARALAADGAPKVLVGDVANTLALETPYRAFVSRDLERMNLGTGWVNGDWRAMGATHWVGGGPPGEPWTAQCPRGSRLLWSRPVWPAADGTPRLVLHLCDLAGALPEVRLRSTLPSSPLHDFTSGPTP